MLVTLSTIPSVAAIVMVDVYDGDGAEGVMATAQMGTLYKRKPNENNPRVTAWLFSSCACEMPRADSSSVVDMTSFRLRLFAWPAISPAGYFVQSDWTSRPWLHKQ